MSYGENISYNAVLTIMGLNRLIQDKGLNEFFGIIIIYYLLFFLHVDLRKTHLSLDRWVVGREIKDFFT